MAAYRLAALEVGGEPRPAVCDLSEDLGLVDELCLEDALDGARGLRFDRRPRLAPREVGPQIGAGRGRGGVAAEQVHEHEPDAARRDQALPRNPSPL